jgi:hypothetical protein
MPARNGKVVTDGRSLVVVEEIAEYLGVSKTRST